MQIQDISSYLKIVHKWWWAVVLLLATTVGTMLAIAFLAEVQYEATTIILISAPPPQEAPLFSKFGRLPLIDEIAQTRDSFSELLLEGEAVNATLAALPEIKVEEDELRERITMETPESPNLLRVHMRASDRDTAALLANVFVEAGLEQYGELLAAPTVNTRVFIDQQFEVAQAELKAAEAELEQFKIDNKIGALKDAITTQYKLIENLHLQSDRARVEGDTIRVNTLGKIMLEREAELQNIVGLSAEYNQLTGRVEQARNTHTFLLDRKSEAQIKEAQIRELASIQIITPARPPKRPVAAINNKLIILGAIASLLAGMLLTFLLEYLEISGAFRSRKIDAPSEVIALSENVS